MKEYVVFGAGKRAKLAIELIGKDNIKYFVDNDKSKSGTKIDGINVYHFNDKIDDLKKEQIIVSVLSFEFFKEISAQFLDAGITSFEPISIIQQRKIKEKIQSRPDYIGVYNKAINWVKKNTVENEGIINNTTLKKSYPEVTGYYIPTLIRWGYKDLAVQYAKYLLSIQKEDGSWYDTENKSPYVFDTAQILKGLIAVRKIYPHVDEAIIKGCDWIISNMLPSGRLTTPDNSAWKTGRACSELIHIYCLSPLKEAGVIFNRPNYVESVGKIWSYYKTNCYDEIMNFSLLSHFYAYLMEALVDIGEIEMATKAMKKIEKFQNENGMVPAYNDVEWVCSTGLFQLALVWFKLGNIECGEKAFEYACKLQNETGGWYGGYIVEENSTDMGIYFENIEISWAVKYFLDALYYKHLALFQLQAPTFREKISKIDGRYLVVFNGIKEQQEKKGELSVLDIGCGKGCFLKNLVEDLPNNKYTGVDLSVNVMEYFSLKGVEKKQGSLTNIPFSDNSFDVIYTNEALEHAVDIKSAIAEMARVLKPGGKIIIIDKTKEKLGRFEIEKWEQWFDDEELKNILENYCDTVQIKKNVSFEGIDDEDVFHAWIGVAKK